MQGKKRQPKKDIALATWSKAAAKRLLALARPGEPRVRLAERIGESDQLLGNYAKGPHGMSLAVLVRIAPKLTDNELLYVVAGRHLGSEDSRSVEYQRGTQDAFWAARRAIDAAEGAELRPIDRDDVRAVRTFLQRALESLEREPPDNQAPPSASAPPRP